ncbi:hypothetical protein N7492_002940 [Penicillium capsulatum]|uniref:Uncharacterized protein n=1 Tax=Penicillium capsulatum TaxID=69766 RepID=A0A9W9IMM4_9EURO|nr:hypothetical protein N7492_002940 [Penicillium capsulatum]
MQTPSSFLRNWRLGVLFEPVDPKYVDYQPMSSAFKFTLSRPSVQLPTTHQDPCSYPARAGYECLRLKHRTRFFPINSHLPRAMADLYRVPTHPHEEYTTRVIWAAHIVSYLTNNRNQEKLHDGEYNEECDSEIDDSSDGDGDETEKNLILAGPRKSIHRKFLDCIAQLLSPCKGWDGVTATAIREGEDGVEVDIARNDGFLSVEDCIDIEVVGHCRMLEEYLARSAEGTNETATEAEFDLAAIDYASRRTDHWIEKLRKHLEIDQNSPVWHSQRSLGQEAAVNTWTSLTDIMLRFDPNKEAVQSRRLIVQQAYRFLKSTNARHFLLTTFGANVGLKLWSQLSFIARPLVDCRLLGSIAAREPQFQRCKIFLVPSKSKTTLEVKDVVEIFEAWERLGLGSPRSP